MWQEEPLLILFSKVVLIALLFVLGRFQQHLCPTTLTVHILMRLLGESTQLCDRPENSVVRGAIGQRAFNGRFDCVVGFLGRLQQHLC